MASPSAYDEGLLGFVNPANTSLIQGPDLRFIWGTDGRKAFSIDDWGLYTGIRHLGFSVQRQFSDGSGITDYRLNTGFGDRGFMLGFGYGWSSGQTSNRDKHLSVGTIIRPLRYLSFGLTGNFSLENSIREAIAEAAVRPFGTPKLALFVDTAPQSAVDFKDTPWSAGAVWQLTPGIDLAGRYLSPDKAVTFGLNLTFGHSRLGAQAYRNNSDGYLGNSYQIRLGGPKPSHFPVWLDRDKRYYGMHLQGRVDYLKYAWLDNATIRFIDIINNIQAAIDDPRVSVIAVNMSGLQIRPENAWEIRDLLAKARKVGKKVITYVDRNGMTGYHLASVADYIVMDPVGQLVLPGYSLSQTYLKGTLEKLGLGFDEWRFFKYKSANEAFSRTDMSVADREQTQAFVDDWYETTRADVCDDRGIGTSEFDRIVDDEGFILAERALQLALVDTLARWSDIGSVVRAISGKKKAISGRNLAANLLPPQNWGITPKIAIVYALGTCDMSTGIRARWLESLLGSLSSKKSVKAIVLRVDSPGGDGMASDVVAQALRKCAKKKPVIVSMGQTAASGGYWISMYADTILAGPTTLTGSIGVISGWVWDAGFGEKLGMTSDLVKRGKHADLWQGVRLPLLNITIPARPVTAQERARAEMIIMQLYDDFVEKVADARGIEKDRVAELAEGRVYSGRAAQSHGLVDGIGGLAAAIELAVQNAGLHEDEDVEWIEYPSSKGLLNIRGQLSPVRVSESGSAELDLIRLFSERGGQPLPLLMPGFYPDFAD